MDIDELQTWLSGASNCLIRTYGLDASFAPHAALLYLILSISGLSPVITSGWRSPQQQSTLLARYQAGDPGVVARPSTNSLHLHTTLSGDPASLAIDISTNSPAYAARIADMLNIGAGYYFTSPDPVHFYYKST